MDQEDVNTLSCHVGSSHSAIFTRVVRTTNPVVPVFHPDRVLSFFAVVSHRCSLVEMSSSKWELRSKRVGWQVVTIDGRKDCLSFLLEDECVDKIEMSKVSDKHSVAVARVSNKGGRSWSESSPSGERELLLPN